MHKMAEATEAPRNRLPSGYDEKFVNGVEDDFQCLICHLALKEPVQTRCGHRFCKECLEEHFRRCGTGIGQLGLFKIFNSCFGAYHSIVSLYKELYA